MDAYLTALKDILVVMAPLIIAYINYRSNKKSQRDIKYEVEKVTKEKEAETKQILERIGAELESQKQLISWHNSMPQTNEYTKLIEPKRFGNVSALPALCNSVNELLKVTPSLDVLVELEKMLEQIDLPSEEEELFPHEVPLLLNYKMVKRQIEMKIAFLRAMDENKGEKSHANT